MNQVLLILILVLVLVVGTFADSPPNIGEAWNSLSNNERVAYLHGFAEGYNTSFVQTLLLFDSDSSFEALGNLVVKEFLEGDYKIDNLEIDFATLSKTMTNLFEDPANSYIGLADMITISKYKVKGELVETKLLEARKKALRLHEQLKKLQQDGE